MLASNGWRAFVLGIILTALCASIYAQQKVYKWVDEDGVVHFSEEQPAVPPDVKVEVITTDATPPPPPVPPTHTTVRPPPPAAAQVETQSVQPESEVPPLIEQVDITKMSLAELDRRCEEAREQRIAPLREAEIARCKANRRNDPAWCERFNADFGDGGRTVGGTIRPRMFDDLPECAEALNERNRRPR